MSNDTQPRENAYAQVGVLAGALFRPDAYGNAFRGTVDQGQVPVLQKSRDVLIVVTVDRPPGQIISV